MKDIREVVQEKILEILTRKGIYLLDLESLNHTGYTYVGEPCDEPFRKRHYYIYTPDGWQEFESASTKPSRALKGRLVIVYHEDTYPDGNVSRRMTIGYADVN